MRKPQQQADFFRLYAKLLCYIVSGNSLVPYMDKSERNPYYKEVIELNVSTPARLIVTENRCDRCTSAL